MDIYPHKPLITLTQFVRLRCHCNATNNELMCFVSCLAVAEVVRGRPLNDAVDRLPALWQSAFRVRDDIKESVRNAADITCRALMKV